MIITFCGHADFDKNREYEEKLLDFIEEKVGNEAVEFYLGGYGAFDRFAYDCCNKYKRSHPNVSLVLVTPYMTVEYQQNHLEYEKARYDAIIYPDIEDKPPRFAISYRNKYMVEAADCVVAYVCRRFGGAFATYQHAKRKGKEIFNLAELA